MGTASFGGDSLNEDLNVNFDKADMAFVTFAALLAWIMVTPGVGLFYAGLARKKHSLSLVWACLAISATVWFQWFFWGYSFVFSPGGGTFWGDLQNFGMRRVLGAPSVAADSVPDILYMFFQGMFAAITGVLLLGGAHERARLGPMMVFVFIWITVVYCPLAEWTWNPNGWLASKVNALDYAGGGPVHMASGVGALAYALVLGKRKDPAATRIPQYKPGSALLCVLGTCFLWFGWFGFNGGSAGSATIRAIYSMANTNIAASTSGLTWVFVDYLRKGRWSTIGFCSGVVSGLVGITPGAGYVPIYFALAIGGISGVVCNFATGIKHLIRIDDGLDVFAIHGVGGAVGSLLTGLFAADYISHLDGETIAQGWLNHNYVQLARQLAAVGAVVGWSFVLTTIILVIMNFIPFLKLRMSDEDEKLGSDAAQLEEHTMFEEDDNLKTIGTVSGQSPRQDILEASSSVSPMHTKEA